MEAVFQAKLNPPQHAAVQHRDGPLLILAGAGSGKTRVITHRIAYLIKVCHVLPERILAVTFTNKAAQEMRERVHQLLGASGLPLWLSTFHAACARLLRREAEALRLSPQFVIYDTADQQALVKQCAQELKIDQELYTPQQIMRRISALKNELIDAETFLRDAGDFGLDEVVARVYPMYQRALRDNAAVDFDDLLMLTVQLLRRHPDILERYQQRWHYIMVDEYQDTNMAQYHMLHLLAAQHRNLCVVGDDDQSVYRFRGANVRNILNFERDYPDATVIKLEQNYRSSGTILDAATAVVAKNPGRKEKTLWTDNDRGTPIGYFCAQDDVHEAETICQNIKGLRRSEGLAYRDFAIFYRTNAQSRVLEDGLRRAAIPYQIVGGLRFYDRQEIKDALAYLRLLVNPRDTLSLRRIINVPRRGIGQTTWSKIEVLAAERGVSGLEALELSLGTDLVNRGTLTKLQTFHTLLRGLMHDAPHMSVADITREVLMRTGYEAQLQAERTPEAQGRLENLSELVNAADEFDRQMPGASLQEFLEHTALISDQDGLADDSGTVVLMTLHASKGLEFPVVFMAGMENGLFPHNRSFDEPVQMEEERRLCYVGMTRAEQRLFLTSAARRRIYGVEQSHTPSLFLNDIPPACIQDYSAQAVLATVRQPWSGADTAVAVPAPVATPTTGRGAAVSASMYGVGTQVFHQHFGRGVVQKREGEGEQLKVTVAFRDHGVKKLLAKFAPMQPLSSR
ncbi:MAG: DNA helicase PcrA [Candidatus Tectomicrobia bacterium]|uniref:ATP-dependent DNA helicase n=1 Tax=Tectimicrobiota bacterium TaxID=2528274 RepID=A0A937VZB4_UNCTE|nr:DNA helicase PcrA [Candidatus Tectomicrobia bacterium]